MNSRPLRYYLSHLDRDIPAGIVVFLVALPLCLGIALAAGAPLLSGIIGGVVGGLVVSWASGSQLSVSGPAAGLTVIVVHSIQKLGGFQPFLHAVVIAGGLQLLLGLLKAGVISAYFPVAVIKGMLTAIGIILILKQIPHAVGYDADYEGDESFDQSDAHTTFSEIGYSLDAISPGAVAVSLGAILIMLLFDSRWLRGHRFLTAIPGPLVAVLWGVGFNLYASGIFPDLAIRQEHLVNLPVLAGPGEFFRQLTWPDFSQWANPDLYIVAATLALVASLETLLSIEAVDKIDPLRRVAPTNRELLAQGLGNVLAGLLGGLPMTSVIVRSSANVNAGARTKLACFLHGVLLFLCVAFLADSLNRIPLACLAAILILTGYRLARPALFREMYRKGASQFIPFVVTLVAILLTDLLKGMAIGLVLGIYYVIRANYSAAISLTQDGRHYLLRLQRDVSFLNKALLRDQLARIGENGYVIIDATRALFIDQDIQEAIVDYVSAAAEKNITVELKHFNGISGIVTPGAIAARLAG